MLLSSDEFAQTERLRYLYQFLGWRFQLIRTEEPPHHIDELVYSKHHGLWLDVLRIRSATDARASRLLYDSVVRRCPVATWWAEGTLTDVLDRLTDLE